MCTYHTERIEVCGSGKGATGWFRLTDASVYFDHPVHAPADHTLNIDFLSPAEGAAARVAVELTAGSALALAEAIMTTLATAPPGLVPPAEAARAQTALPQPPDPPPLHDRG
jgi:hypothetical protein